MTSLSSNIFFSPHSSCNFHYSFDCSNVAFTIWYQYNAGITTVMFMITQRPVIMKLNNLKVTMFALFSSSSSSLNILEIAVINKKNFISILLLYPLSIQSNNINA